jgi:TorA maturation chaperone TorD
MRRASVLFIPTLILAGALGNVASGTAHAGVAATLAAVTKSSSSDRVIYRVFRDVLDREPTDRELQRYRERMQAEDWTEQDLRNSLRRRSQFRESARTREDVHTSAEADRIVERAYRDVLDREPDAAGLRNYRRSILEDNWSEAEVRQSLRESRERRGRGSVTRESAEQIVRRAYISTLGREPDAAGSRGYVDGVLREGWTQEEVERDLRKSPEYRSKH